MSPAGSSVPGGTRPCVVLGVSGGIAAYKAVEVLRRLTESGHEVTVVPTEAALRMVGEPTWAALSGRPVATDVWTDVESVPHVALGRTADLVLVVPATADLLARAAVGRADDLLTATLLTATCPVVYAPAMHTEMWLHPATRANVATLRARGCVVVEPATGRLTGADSGPGRLPDPVEIAALARSVLARGGLSADLSGRHVVVSSGGTREPIDPVRFLGNRSSGLQGHALARAAVARGATVTLVSSAALPDPAGVDVVRVGTALEMRDAVLAAVDGRPGDGQGPAEGRGRPADVVVMAAAVADFRPADPAAVKLKRSAGTPTLALVPNPDVLAELCARPGRQYLTVGFAAETGDASGDVLAHGRAKLASKGCDLLVVNDVSGDTGFGTPDNAAVLLGADGGCTEVPRTSKDLLAHAVWDAALARLPH